MLGGYSKIIVPFVAYIAMFAAIYLSLSKKKDWALLITLPLFCLPNVRMRLEVFPLGKDFIDIVYLCLFLGLIVKGEFSFKDRSGFFLFLYILLLIISFFVIGERLDGQISQKHLADFKNYIMMPITYFLVFNTIQTKKSVKLVTIVLSMAFIAMDRSTYGEYGLGLHQNYVDDQRPGGAFGAEGLGANHLGSFMAQYTMILIGICGFIGRKFLTAGAN